MTDVNLTISGQVESLHLEPGDRLIVTLDQNISIAALERIRTHLVDHFAPHQVVVLANGLRITKETHPNIAEITDQVHRELLKRQHRGGYA